MTSLIYSILFSVAYSSYPVGDIPNLPPGLDETSVDFKVNRKIFIHDGSIAELECDVIVVPALKNMAPNGLPLVYKAAGEELSKSAKKFAPKQVS